MTVNRLGRYCVVRKLGQGGMGIVYEGWDEQLGRPVALKTLSPTQADEAARQRLWREARALARVRHPNICQIFEVSEDAGELFLVMELLPGESLDVRLQRGALPFRDAVQVALEMLAALTALHAENLVHRDLKPSNIFLTPHGVKLLDFGLAKPTATTPPAEETETQLTAAGAILGTPQYMAPEQLQGKPADTRSDLFAAGLVLFEMLTGAPPFRGKSAVELCHAILTENPPALSGSPAVLAADRVLRRALAKAPEARYGSSAAMAEDLRRMMSEISTHEAPRPQRVTRLMVMPFPNAAPRS